MNDEHREAVLEDLQRSGFGSELRAAGMLLAQHWEVQSGFATTDARTGTTREVDIWASGSIGGRSEAGHLIRARSVLFIEVKKSDRTWVVLRDLSSTSEPESLAQFERLEMLDDLVASAAVAEEAHDELYAPQSLFSLWLENGWRAHGVHESFKKAGDKSTWYGAGVKAISAARLERATEWLPPFGLTIREGHGAFMYREFRPLIVLDGDLAAAGLSASGELLVDDARWASVDVVMPGEGDRTEGHVYANHGRVDLVTMAAFPEYLQRCEQRLRVVTGGLERAAAIHGLKGFEDQSG